ncbi:hypothetical protein CK203_033225 [Vitis vinifera]|uniref:Uncharacterized protein n=1 Tax=Vitis vinifera TaxID=29760 RepID=A0A438HBX5_VITVI|nr:hypothetical protein CK203_033225 [Vitis vinifera]
MMSVACRSLDFGPTGFDLVACGCSSNAQFDRVFSTRAPETLLNGWSFGLLVVTDTGVGQGPPPALDVKKESSSSMSLASFF